MTAVARRLLAVGGRLYPYKSGCARYSSKPKAMKLIGPEPFDGPVRLRNGARCEVLNDFVGRAALVFGDLDRKVTAVVEAVLRPGDMTLDVGANVGIVSMFAAKKVGPTGAVHAFEPQPDLARMIRDSAALNHYDQVRVHEVALSDADGEAALNVSEGNRGNGSLEARQRTGRFGAVSVVPVATRQASTYLAGLGEQRARLMKVDIEGHEETFFAAAADYLRRLPPDVIVFENTHGGTVPAMLRDLGYQIFAVPKAKLRVRLVPDAPDAVSHDFVAVHEPAVDELRRVLHIAASPDSRDAVPSR
jgi:FkbM family methyltransferase